MAKNKPKPPSTETSREEFEYQLDVAKRIVTAVTKLGAINPTAAKPLHIKHVARIVELAFMGAVASWEDFLEGTFVRYMAGAKSKSGYSPTLRLGPSETLNHAYDVLAGEHAYDPSKSYMTWNKPADLISLAKVFFADGKPYEGPLTREQDRLKAAVGLRNRIAHASEKCKEDFAGAVNRIRQAAKGTALGQGTTVGQVLLETAGAFFGKGTPARKINVFTAYLELLQAAAQDISPR